jgi:WD40 repeat protein
LHLKKELSYLAKTVHFLDLIMYVMLHNKPNCKKHLYAFCVSAKMAMEYRQIIQDAHSKPILCLQYNPFRREIYTSGEDSAIRVWESESGKLLNTWIEHIGWVTQLLYWYFRFI